MTAESFQQSNWCSPSTTAICAVPRHCASAILPSRLDSHFEGQGMLARLSIRDIVLIDRLDLDFAGGLAVLTGETGAGKSILLDAFALALGARGDASLVRQGAAEGQVTAAFELKSAHPAHALLEGHGIAADDELILRRMQFADGRTRAFVNDQPVSAQVLKSLGATLVEIH